MNDMQGITLASLAAAPCWVAWQTEDRQAGKPTKVPYAAAGRTGQKAHADKPHTWGTRDQAEAKAKTLPKPYGAGGVGIEFHDLDGWRSCGGIDLDTCRDPETGQIADWAQSVIDTFATYTEVSPSGTGVKAFFLFNTADWPLLRQAMGGAKFGKQFKRGGGDHPEAIELHLGNRYFAVTDQVLSNGAEEFRHADTETLIDLISITGPAFAAGDDGEEANAAIAAQAAPPRNPRASQKADRSRSAVAMAVGVQAVRDGADYEAMCAALRSNLSTVGWMQDKGEANGQREARRIFEKAKAGGPLIRITAGEIHLAATASENALIGSGIPIYQRGDNLVRPLSREVTASRGRTTIAAGLGEISVHSLVDVLAGCAVFERFDSRAEDWARINPPLNVVQVILARHGQWRLPPISGVITTPTLRPDGSVLSEPGYDRATRLYHFDDPAVQLHPAVLRPSRAAAEDALKSLEGLLAEFPFTNSVAKAVALSGLITPVVRGALTVAPLHLFRANTAGSGKSYLADIASAISTGRPCPVISAAPDEGETEKRLAGLLLAGYPLISLDNVNGELGGDLLCQAVERPLIRLRRLGASDITEIESCATILATGNNARVRGDMVRRTVVADLDANMERPELRKFKSDPVATVLADRGRFVSACLVIVRAYIQAGKPNVPAPLASFSDWSNLVRGALIWLGCPDPVTSMDAARADDPELTELGEMLTVWSDAFGADALTTRAIAQAAEERLPTKMGEPTELKHPDLREALLRLFGERGSVNTRRLGKWLSAKEGRIVAGQRFKRAATGGQNGVVRWQIEAPR